MIARTSAERLCAHRFMLAVFADGLISRRTKRNVASFVIHRDSDVATDAPQALEAVSGGGFASN
jgi:hypothetical protein